jgi:hypothetical protein
MYMPNVSFEIVGPSLSKRTASKSVTELQTYADEDPAGFAEGFFFCIVSANRVSPLYPPIRKQRGGRHTEGPGRKCGKSGTRRRICICG